MYLIIRRWAFIGIMYLLSRYMEMIRGADREKSILTMPLPCRLCPDILNLEGVSVADTLSIVVRSE